MGEKLFDDLARALAEPMPRRRALRFIGAVLVATSFPRPAFGSNRRPARASKCGKDQRVCREFTDKEYCCPAPSWQFFCGSRSRQCLNMCEGGTKFPCTAKIPHPESGINGVCCDFRYHSRCEPVGKPPECCYGNPDKLIPVKCVRMGEAQCKAKPNFVSWVDERWKPRCIACRGEMCGPNKSVPDDDPQVRARWTCCKPPATCRKGVCKCKDGRESCDEKCCQRGEDCTTCYEVTFDLSDTLVGRKCCKTDHECCGNKCCKKLDEQCVYFKGETVCCPIARTFVSGIGTKLPPTGFCCPAGTVARRFGCCPLGDQSCCPPQDSQGNPLSCGQNVCINGQCVTP